MIHPSRQAMMDIAIAERQRKRDWLLPHMKGGKPSAFTKEQYRLLAALERPRSAFGGQVYCCLHQKSARFSNSTKMAL